MLSNYQKTFINVLQNSSVKIEGSSLTVADGIGKVQDLVLTVRKNGKHVFFIGNGASASIASHIATDFIKTLQIKGIHISDNSLLTCISNDLEYKNVYAYPLQVLAGPGDILIAISSSGESENILQAVKAAQKKDCSVITLSGFAENNKLSRHGNVNFYVPSNRYGYVEIIHTYILHWLVDLLKEQLDDETLADR